MSKVDKIHTAMPGLPPERKCDCTKRVNEAKRLRCSGCAGKCPKCEGTGMVRRPLALCGAFEEGTRFEGVGEPCKKCAARAQAHPQLANQLLTKAADAFEPGVQPATLGDAGGQDEPPTEFSGAIQ